MTLSSLSILNYKNIEAVNLEFSPKINCLIGNNGMGKTNLLDAIYFLSFCHSMSSNIDSQMIRHNADFFVINGEYADGETHDEIAAAMKRGHKKTFRRNKKAYKRLSEHIGLIPLIFASPDDVALINGGSEERRRFLDIGISQTDSTYIPLLNNYNKALQQRNAMLKMSEEGTEPDPALLSIWEEEMARNGEAVYEKRQHFVEHFIPVFNDIYGIISGQKERVSLEYHSHCQRGPLLDVIQRDRRKDLAVGYSLHGIHKDDLLMLIEDYPMKREASQGQAKTYVIAMKLALFEYLKNNTETHTMPILLLDDIFDKLDADRVEHIINMVAGQAYGQIFITDTNRDHLDKILSAGNFPYKLFNVNQGQFQEI